MKQTLEEALLEHENRMNATLVGLMALIRQTTFITKQLVQEEGHATNNNTCAWQPQSNNTEVITAIYINVDATVGGTFTLTLGRRILKNVSVPTGGLLVIDQQNIVLRPNDTRQIVITPTSGTASFINIYMDGREVGDFGGIA